MRRFLAGAALSALLIAAPALAQNGGPTGGGASITTPVSVANGGTGLSSLTSGSVVVGNGSSSPSLVAPGTSGNVLTSNGTAWTSSAAAGGGCSTTCTLTGQQTLSGNGAASAPNLIQTGTPYAGGTGTTTWPLWLEQPTGTTSSVWSTNGTYFGVNAASGFTGNLFDFQSGGASRATLSSAGQLSATNLSASNTLELNGIGYASHTAPTIASGFGTSPTIPSNNGSIAFSVNVGTGGTSSSGVLTMPTAPHAWSCQPNDITNNATSNTVESASTTTSITLTNYSRTTGTATPWTASDVVYVSCMAF